MSDFRLTTLPGGLRVVSEAVPSVRSVSLGFWIGAGSRDEPGERAGVSHFIEHLLFRGSSRYDALEIAQTFDGLGAELNAETGKDFTLLHARVLDEHVETALDVMADMVQEPTWDELPAERDVVLEEIAMYEDAPDDLVHDLVSAAVFGEHDPLGRPIIGTEGTVASLGVSEVSAFHRRLYVPPNVVLSAAGNIDHDALLALLRPRLGWLAAGDGEPPRMARVDAGEATRRLFVRKDTEQYHVCLGGTGLRRTDDRRFAWSLLDAILGGTASSRLFQEIREKRGMAYAVYSYGSHYADTGQVALYCGTRAENLGACLAIAREQLEAIGRGDLSQAELQRAKDHVKGRILLSLESTSARMSRLGKGILTGVEILTPEAIAAAIDAVDRDLVVALAAELYAPDRLSAAGIGPDQGRFDDALAGAALAGAA